MCGICGFANINDKDLLIKMTHTIKHRGPDSEGIYFDGNVGLGIRRLKIIDLETGDQPIHNEDKTVWLVYNGEIYNFQKLRTALEQKGHKFYSHSDTEVIVHMYEEYGKDFVKQLRGMFGFALWDNKKKQLFIVRDHIGIKPIYYSIDSSRLIFGSELKTLLCYKNISREINYNAIDTYLSYLYIPSPITIYKSINKLLPGHLLLWQDGEIKIEKYWDLDNYKIETEIDEKKCIEQLDVLLKDTIKNYLVSDVSLGVFLSGGLDSSSIVALVSEITNKPVKTFNISYGKKYIEFNETEKARSVVRKFGCEHYEEILEPKLKDFLPTIVNHFDEPFADSSAIPNYLISKVARKNVKVALTGVGGDEIFVGYPRYFGAYLYNLYTKIPYFLRYAISKFSYFFPQTGSSRDWSGRIKRFLKNGTLDLSVAYKLWMTSINYELKNKLYSKDMISNIGDNGVSEDEISKYFNLLKNGSVEKIFYIDLKTYLVDDLLCLADRMSMANSLELRVPFCDINLIEFLSKIPFKLKIKNNNMKYLLKKVMKNVLPDEILNQKKMGFMIPLKHWLKEETVDLLREYFNDSVINKRKIFNNKVISWMIEQHINGKYNFSDQIWSMIVLEEWFRNFVE